MEGKNLIALAHLYFPCGSIGCFLFADLLLSRPRPYHPLPWHAAQGDGATRSIFRGPIQFLFSEVYGEDGTVVSGPADKSYRVRAFQVIFASRHQAGQLYDGVGQAG